MGLIWAHLKAKPQLTKSNNTPNALIEIAGGRNPPYKPKCVRGSSMLAKPCNDDACSVDSKPHVRARVRGFRVYIGLPFSGVDDV